MDERFVTMSNSLRGAVSFEAFGQPMTLVISTAALVAYQDIAGETFLKGWLALEQEPGDVKRIRDMALCAMSHHDGVTASRVNEIMDEIGVFTMSGLLAKAIALAFPAPEKEAAGNGKAAKSKSMTTAA
jgi:hypothetical protein